ncbi:MAG: protein kinase [Gemmatimonadaceae bacterium]
MKSAGETPTALQPLAGRYVIERELGRGGMATVYVARDLRHERRVAVKVLHPELASAVGAERFVREIRTAAQLQHPHILPLHDSGEADGALFYVMPLVEGETLRERLRREVQLPVGEAVRIARELADALDYAHRHGVVHRDVKPENVLLADGHALVTDFGIARALDAAADGGLTETGLAVGTPAYMSPEQASGERRLDGRSDVYSLGCVLYEMLAGEPPFTGPSAQAVMAKRLAHDPLPVRATRTGIPAVLEAAVAKALARVPADRFVTAGELRDALGAATEPASREPRRAPLNRRTAAAIAGAGLAAVALAAVVLPRLGGSDTLDENLVAVAPFEVFSPEFALWREGLVDLLSRRLDGAGPLHTVPPTIVIRRWKGRGDLASAVDLGRRTGARVVVVGSLVRSGRDSVRLGATLYDGAAGRAVGDVEVSESMERMDRLADSATIKLLRELNQARPIGAVRSSSIESRSLPALKAFLQGEQAYRRLAFDSAVSYYERAAALDSTFILALWRAGKAFGWTANNDHPGLADQYFLRAGALNQGLAPRESLLVVGDSIDGALYTGGFSVPLAERLLRIREETVRRYPNDPAAWLELGEVRYHWGRILDVMPQEALEAFERAITLDSAFGPAYLHLVEIAVTLGDLALARSYTTAYLKQDSSSAYVAGEVFRLVEHALRSPPAAFPEIERLARRATVETRSLVFEMLGLLADSAETAVRLARHGTDPDSSGARQVLARALTTRGHLREAWPLPASPGLRVELTLFGAAPPDTAEAVFRTWLRDRNVRSTILALRWWTARRDTLSLARAGVLFDSLSSTSPDSAGRVWARYGARVAPAYIALARGDTAQAISRFRQLPQLGAPTPTQYLHELVTRTRLLANWAPDRSTLRTIEAFVWNGSSFAWPSRTAMALDAAHIAERLGERERALRAYRNVVEVWRTADPALQPYVTEARRGLERLRGGR